MQNKKKLCSQRVVLRAEKLSNERLQTALGAKTHCFHSTLFLPRQLLVNYFKGTFIIMKQV